MRQTNKCFTNIPREILEKKPIFCGIFYIKVVVALR